MSWSTHDYGCKLVNGDEAKIQVSIYPNGDFHDEITGVLENGEIEKQLEKAVYNESVIYQEILASTDKWVEAAKKTRIIQMAADYTRIPPAQHTNNKLVAEESSTYRDSYEISNAVYRLYYCIYRNTKYNKETKENDFVSWDLSWSLRTNSPIPYNLSGKGNVSIDGQEKKLFRDKEQMEKYIEGRMKKYKPLFNEAFPAIPEKFVGIFSYKGKFLEGYKAY